MRIPKNMERILRDMMDTMNSVKPPRMTALRQLHDVEKGDPFAILIGTILSARSKDENTTKVVGALFKKYKGPKQLAAAKAKDVEKIIHLDSLVQLPGVGRKTANCVLVYAYDKPAIPVDVHVHRISNRIGIVETKTPEETELALIEKIPKKYWLKINDTFVMYGQNICKPVSPMCKVCRLSSYCDYYKIMNAS